MLHYADTKIKRDVIRQIINSRKQQLLEFEKLMKPIKDDLVIAEKCLKQKECLEVLFRHNKGIRDYYKRCFYELNFGTDMK